MKPSRRWHDPFGSGYVFRSHTFLLGWTIEKIWLPQRSRLAARVEGKSSLARLGIGVHVTAPTIHAGFGYKKDDEAYPGSPLQLEIWNVGPLDPTFRDSLSGIITQLTRRKVHNSVVYRYPTCRGSTEEPKPPG